MKNWKDKLARYMPICLAIVGGAAISVYTVKGHAQVSTAIGSDVSARELRALTIESWDRDYSLKGYGWEVVTNREQTYRGADYEPIKTNKLMERTVRLIKGTPRDIKENLKFDKAYVLGVKFAFTFPGENVVTIRPPRRADGKVIDQYMSERARPYLNETAFTPGYKPISCFQDASRSVTRISGRSVVVDCVNGIEMPGQVKAISVWVNGRGNEYNLEGWVEDWKGDVHILKFGSIDFVGWRPMTVNVPRSIPQDVRSYPQIKTLIFKQFKLRARKDTSLETVYLFLDELRILTDVFEVHFDGAQLHFDQNDCNTKQRLLSVIRKNARFPERFPDTADCSKAPETNKVNPIPDISGPAPAKGGGGGGGGGGGTN